MSSTDFCGGHVSSIDFLCLEQDLCLEQSFLCLELLQNKKKLFQTQKIYGGHMSSAEICGGHKEICGGHVSSIDFGTIQTKNNGPF